MRTSMKKQSGVALFVCLMILLIISMLAISALRMSMSQTQVATSSLAADIVFQAAETAINKTVIEGEADLNDRVILPVSYDAPITRCISAASTTTTAGACGSSVYADSKAVTKATVVISVANPDDPAVAKRNLQAMVAFGAVPGVSIEQFKLESTTAIDAVDISTTHVQEVLFPHL